MKVYLKNKAIGNHVKCFNKTNLTVIDIFRNTSVDISKYEDLDFLEERLAKELESKIHFTDWQVCSREEFNAMAIEFGKNYNNLISEL